MNQLSFEVRTTTDFFHKLMDDYNEFLKNITSSRLALNCAMTAWHLFDWVFNEFYYTQPSPFNSVSDFQRFIKQQCRSLQIMHDLTNGTKHYLLNRRKPDVKETKLHNGGFSREFSRDFDISILEIELNDGTTVYFEDEIKNVIEFWRDYLNSNFGLNL